MTQGAILKTSARSCALQALPGLVRKIIGVKHRRRGKQPCQNGQPIGKSGIGWWLHRGGSHRSAAFLAVNGMLAKWQPVRYKVDDAELN
ncbi:hypothetical protein EB241_10945 [Erwinia psidii]|uniref:Uncharacterized protein n=1 Tax=Erwinia psidii TaxID=69224 RepID=A0A3N6RYM3_9GAMM|nr:hypothetical protein EB241_10945 [Erwinia psidii]